MKTLLTALFLLITFCLSAADWLIGAEYRLEVHRDAADRICAIDLRRLLLMENQYLSMNLEVEEH